MEDNYNYIIVVHINRNFNKEKKSRINFLPNINPDINQIFIDNLYAFNEITFRDLFANDIKSILEDYKEELKLDDEFHKTLDIFMKDEFKEKNLNIDITAEFIQDVHNYMDNEDIIKEKIIEIIYKFIDREREQNCKDIIKKIYKNNMINKYTVDIETCLILYIKEEIFNKYLKIIFQNLEDNNILTTLLNIEKREYQLINKNQVELIMEYYLDEINLDKNHIYKSKFLFNYNVPGIYNFLVFISNYIHNTIALEYSKKIIKRIKK